jgi:hypothetical protein
MAEREDDEGAGPAQPDEDPNSRACYASPPCFMHELDPSYLGYMNRDELLTMLNELLEAERAGARGVAALARRQSEGPVGRALHDVAADEARFCAMLTRHIRRLGGQASRTTGGFYDKLMAQRELAAQLRLLDRGQGWVVRRLREALGRIGDDALHADLRDMLDVHERNIVRCATLQA